MTVLVRKTIEVDVVMLLNADGSVNRAELFRSGITAAAADAIPLAQRQALYAEGSKPVAGKVRVWRKDGVLVYRTFVRATKQHFVLLSEQRNAIGTSLGTEAKYRRMGGFVAGDRDSWSGADRIHEDDLKILQKEHT